MIDTGQINEAGQMSTDVRNESQLVCDILGIESLVDEITFKLAADAVDQPTSSAILGPFWRKDAPHRNMGDTIILKEISDGDYTWIHGKVRDFRTGKPIEGACLDVWHTAPNGMYEQQDPNQPDFNLRGRFTTGPDGTYNFYCLRPTSYPIPFDGPAGKLLQLLDRHPFRPGHIHFIVCDIFTLCGSRMFVLTDDFRLRRLDTSQSLHRSSTVETNTYKTMLSSLSRILL